VRPRGIDFVLQKKESGPYWDHLLLEKGKPRWLKVDWNKWKDEDEVDEADAFDMGGMGNFDMSQFANMNMNDMPEDDEDHDHDSDDEGISCSYVTL
jgi:prostaglandin-E synthase